MAAIETLVPPAAEPLSVAELKAYLRVDFSDDDTLIADLGIAAREWCETFCARNFVTRTMRLSFDFFPGYIDQKLSGQSISSPFVSGSNAVLVGIRYAVILPYPKVRSIVDFAYLDPNGGQQSLTENVTFIADLRSSPARLTPVFGAVWPVARVQINAVWVDYLSGYGAPASISMAAGSGAIGGGYRVDQVGEAVTVPGAGLRGAALVSTIAAVDDGGNATLADVASVQVNNASAWVGDPIPSGIRTAIRKLVSEYYENRGANGDASDAVKRILAPYRDLRL
jgi:hypothetical protein